MSISEKKVLGIEWKMQEKKNNFKNKKLLSPDLKEEVKKRGNLLINIWILLTVFITVCWIFHSGILNVN